MMAAALVLGALRPAWASEPLYRFVDEHGVIHFTNTPTHRGFQMVARRTREAPAAATPRPDPESWDLLIRRAAEGHRLPPALVKAVIRAESNFDPWARSPKGAMGLMQLMPETADELGVRNPYRPQENVWGGTRYLRDMIDRYRDLSLGLAAYNAGPSAVDRHRGIPPYAETQEYVRRVLAYYRYYNGNIRR
jgi:soluble lytic murein transglycosylase